MIRQGERLAPLLRDRKRTDKQVVLVTILVCRHEENPQAAAWQSEKTVI